MSESGDVAVMELVKILLEHRKWREEEATEERRQRNAESRQQLELLTRALEGAGVRREPSGEDNARVRELVLTEILPEQVPIRCAHGTR